MSHTKKNMILYFIFSFLCVGFFNLKAMYYETIEPTINKNNIQSLMYKISPVNAQNACPGIYDLCVTLDITLSHQPRYAQSLYVLLPYNFSNNTEFKNSLQSSYPTSIEKVFGRQDVIKINNITSITSKTIRIKYRVPSIKNLSTITGSTYRNPIITGNYLHMFGENWLVCPCRDKFGNEFSKKFNITLQWSGFPPCWNFANSFAAKTQKQELTKTTRQLKQATYVAGRNGIEELHCNNQSIVFTILDNTSYCETPQKLKEMTQKLMSEYIRFFDNHNIGHQLIAIIPLQNSPFLGGLNYKGSSSLFIGSMYETATPVIAHQLSHELCHIWNGKIIKTKYPRDLMFWFSEGFTDYYADHIALQAKVITPQEHVLLYNNALENLWYSFAKNIPHSKIASNPNNPNYRLKNELKAISYYRGQILAANWNAKIKEATNSQYSLDNVIKALYQKSKTNRNFYVSPETLIETIQSCLPSNRTIEKLIREMKEDLHTYIGINPQQHAVQDINLHPRALTYAEYENTEQLDGLTDPFDPQFVSVPSYAFQQDPTQKSASLDSTMQKMSQKKQKSAIYQDFVENQLLYAILRGGSSIYSGIRRILGIFKYVLTEM